MRTVHLLAELYPPPVARLPVGNQPEFRDQDWHDIRTFLAGMAATHPEFTHMVDVVDSIMASDVQDELAGCTSMHDLLVVPRPIAPPPYDLLRVCSPSSLHPVPPGSVVVEHLAATGNDERISRPVDEAVRLFWRFVNEKFGIVPASRS
jgi:hypothetical protein